MKIFLTIFVLCVALLYYVDGQSRRQGLTMSERVQQLSDMASKKIVLKFNANKYREFIKASPRNYSVIVMFTAMAPQRQCVVCRHANEEFTIVANSFRVPPNTVSNQLFFVTIDFDEGSEVFQMLRLNTAPVFIHFPPKGKPKNADTMDIQRVGFSADAIAKWIHERTDISIRIYRPPTYSGAVAAVVIVSFVGGFLYMRRNNLEFLYNKTMWGVGSLFFCFAMISGQMWNHIRGPPFLHKGNNGMVSYIHGSSQGQFVVETYIVMLLNGFIALGIILLTEAAKGKGEKKKRKTHAIIGIALVCIFFSALLSIFRTKTQGYPYSFLFK